MKFTVQATPTPALAYKNLCFLHPMDFSSLIANLTLAQQASVTISKQCNILVLGKVFPCGPLDAVKTGTICIPLFQRSYCSACLDQEVDVRLYQPTPPKILSEVQLKVSLMTVKKDPNAVPVQIDAEQLNAELISLVNNMYFSPGLKLAVVFKGQQALQLEVVSIKLVVEESSMGGVDPGLFVDKTTLLVFVKSEGVQIKGQIVPKSVNKMLDVDFASMGIGGLDKEFSEIFRRAFASRVYPPKVVEDLGINFVRGLMLYGPPGCGKTLIARQISAALQGTTPEDKKRQPKIVNGPEILSKYVGETEKNLRDLFADAEAEQLESGADSELHVIIFDEIDSIAKKRGSSRDGTGVHDSLVNQLLSKIDGVNALNNILLIGMTNRLDMLDPALLRPGRFEVQVEISLPDLHGRTQILNIHTARMRKAGYLSPDVSIEQLAAQCKNFTGAEIEGLVKNASSFALNRNVESGFKAGTAEKILVVQEDFDLALLEAKPQFGSREAEEEMKMHMGTNLVPFSPEYANVQTMLADLARETATSDFGLSLVSVLLCGLPGSGKTALAAKVAYESGFPLVRILSPDKLIGLSENAKCSAIADIFDEAYKSDRSLILLEDLERLVDYTRVGPRFSNMVLQTLLILIRKPPPKKKRRLFIIGTSSVQDTMESLDLQQVFSMVLQVPHVNSAEEALVVISSVCNSTGKVKATEAEMRRIAGICPLPISVKKLLLALEMAMRNGETLNEAKFMEFLMVS